MIKYTGIFAEKNVRIFCNAKDSHCKRFSHFSNKKYQCICNIIVLNFNEMVTNDVVNFEQPGPDVDCDHYGDTKKLLKLWMLFSMLYSFAKII